MARLTVVCVQQGNYLGRGAEYVNILHDMVRRNLPTSIEGQFVCFTDDPQGLHPDIHIRKLPADLKGWWSKLYLFKDHVFEFGERILYIDLDTCIVGPLDDIAAYRGKFAALEDFARPRGVGSGLMAWEAGTLGYIWNAWEEMGRPKMEGGDQTLIELCCPHPDFWQNLLPNQVVSYKMQNCFQMFPKHARVVCFHGDPRPHNAKGWVEKVWKIGGGSSIEMELRCNTPDDKLLANVEQNMKGQKPFLPDPSFVRPEDAAIVCGGPSLKTSLNMLRAVSGNSYVVAANNVVKWMLANDLEPDAQIIMDARPSNAAFLSHGLAIDYYLASQCDPSLFERCKAQMFHIANPYLIDLLQKRKEPACCIGGGRTVGLIAIGLAIARGHRRVHIFGMDSSYADTHHAYEQPLNDSDEQIEVEYQGRSFVTTPWMVQQVEDFQLMAKHFVSQGIELIVHGDGLLPWVSECMSTMREAA